MPPNFLNFSLYVGYDFFYTLTGSNVSTTNLFMSGWTTPCLDYPATGGLYNPFSFITGSGNSVNISIPAAATYQLGGGNNFYTIVGYTGTSGVIGVFQGRLSVYPSYITFQ